MAFKAWFKALQDGFGVLSEALGRFTLMQLTEKKIMRTSTNVKYIKSALQALREMGEATAGEVAKKIGEDSGSVSGAFGGYRRRGLVKQVGWSDKSPIFIITDLGIGRIEIENGATSNRLKTMSAVYELFKNDSEISSQLISKIIGVSILSRFN